MKTLVVFVAACLVLAITAKPAVEITQEQKAKLDKYREECKQQSNVDVEILKKMREGVFTDDPKLKEFLLCVSKKAGFQNEAGEVQQDVIVEKLGHAMSDEEKAKKLIEKCGTQEGSPAGVVFKVVKCLYDSTPNHIVIIH